MLDIGANTDCRPTYLAQFALMGDAYARVVFGLERPRIGLLNNGEEDTKGSQLTRDAHQLIRGLDLNFVGNVEGKDIPGGMADVVVSDGFAGNVAIKMAEGMVRLMFDLVGREARRGALTKLGGALMRPAFRGVRNHLNYEEYGGAILLGVEGVAVVAHGRSNARAVRSAIRVATQCAQGGIVDRIRDGIAASAAGLATD
jgi:glycerol-3-phosphate acyltransferase PlsX